MKIDCFVEECPAQFASAVDYIGHLRDYHHVPSSYRVPCTYPGCLSVFSKFYSFRRHMINHRFHQDSTVDGDNVICENEAASSVVSCQPQTSHQNVIHSESYHADQSLADIRAAAVNFTLKLHQKNHITRADVRSIQKESQDVFSVIADKIEELPLQISPELQFKFESYIEALKTPFDFINTDYKFLKYLQQNNLYKPPCVITIDNDVVTETALFDPENFPIETEINHIVMMDINFQLKSFFESKNVWKETITHLHELEQSDRIRNIVNGSTWQQVKEKYAGDFVLPLTFYSDEYEINDNLSSHNKKDTICGMYFTCLVIPEKYASKLRNIFVAGTVKKVSINNVGINALMDKVVQKFKSIEEDGVQINVDGVNILVRFPLVMMQGDNLGIHTMLMFAGGFNAKYYCRFCKQEKEYLQRATCEESDYLRNEENYKEDVEIGCQKETGVKGFSEFNKLPSFKVTENKTVDPMHDIFSNGICKYGFTLALNYFIYKKKYLTLNQFNTRKRIISKQAYDTSLCRMPDIEEVYYNKSKSVKFRATAAEMRSFCYYFTMITGSFVPIGDSVWKYVLSLVNLVEHALMPSFSQSDIEKLSRLVTDHHTMYLELFEHEILKPKHHHLVHYAGVIKSSGPVCNLMCFRMEAKHKQFKQYAHISSSRKNICLTLCVKAALQHSYEIHNMTFYENSDTGNFLKVDLKTRPYFSKLVYNDVISFQTETLATQKCRIDSVSYQNGLFVTVTQSGVTELIEIEEILENNFKKYIVGKLWETGEFNYHYLAYEIVQSTQLFRIIDICDIDSPPLMIHLINDKYFYRKKHKFLHEDSDI